MRRAIPVLIFVMLTVAGCGRVHWGYYHSRAAINGPEFLELMNQIADAPVVGGNKIEILENGDEIFPPMIEAIENAKNTINLETYILYEDEIGLMFCEALMRKAREGVEVRLIYDYFGGLISEDTRRRLTEAGVTHYRENDWSWWHMLEGSIRTHRKILVVDGKVGFTGGVGFADTWAGNVRNENEWRDTHVKMEGPVVAQLQYQFLESWHRVSGEMLADEKFYPPLPPQGDTLCAMVGEHTGKREWSKVRKMFLLTLAASRHYFYMTMAYFVPDPDCYRALQDAVERGVDVKVILAGADSDIYANHLIASKNYGRLIQAGVKLYEYMGTTLHSKTLVADGVWSTIGSANFNNRTFAYNFESNLMIYDEKIAAELERSFEIDLARSREVTYTQWARRPLRQRFLEQMVGVIEGWM